MMGLAEIDLVDVLDYAYCPLRVWWRRSDLAPGAEVAAAQGRRAGEQLLRMAVQQALFVYHRYHQERALTLQGALGLVWKIWLERWGLEALARPLVEYAGRRAALLARFGPGGDLRRAGGKPYQRPTWTRSWMELAGSSGLRALQQTIDARQDKAGLGTLALPEEEAGRGPMGLADVFAVSGEMVQKLELPPVGQIVGASVPVAVDLLTVRLRLTADLVIDTGVENLRGRPAAGASPRARRKRVYELHLVEEDLPPIFSLARDLRVVALGQAVIEGEAADAARVEAVRVRHLRSGTVQDFSPKMADGLDVIEAHAVAADHGIRAGLFLPRMLCGWRACGDCDYRGLCFADYGVAQAFNPPLMAQIAGSQALYAALKTLCARHKSATETLEAFLGVLLAHPGVSPATALQMLETIKEEV